MSCLNERKRIEKIMERVKRDLKITSDTKGVMEFDAISGIISYEKLKEEERLSVSNVCGEIFEISLTKDSFMYDYYLLGYKDIYLKVDGGKTTLFIENNKYSYQSEKIKGYSEALEELKCKNNGVVSCHKSVLFEGVKKEIFALVYRTQNKCVESINDIIKYDKKYKKKARKLEKQG